MAYNLSFYDALIRIFLTVILAAVFGAINFLPGLLIANLILVTGLTSWCPIYAALGMNTCQNAHTDQEEEYEVPVHQAPMKAAA